MKHLFYQFLWSFCILSIGLSAYSQDKGIHFFKGSWEEALKLAKEQNKAIYMDCYTNWCAPCKKMEKAVFTQAEVADFYNSNFINVHMDMEGESGRRLGKKYMVNAYPNHLFLDGEGKVLHRTLGYKSAATFIKEGGKALDPKLRSAAMEEAYQEGQRDLDFMKDYLKYLKKTKQEYQFVFDEYLPNLEALEPKEKMQLLQRYTRYVDSEAFQLYLKEEKEISSLGSKQQFDFVLNEIIKNSCDKAAKTKDDQLFKLARTVFQERFPTDTTGEFAQLELNYYRKSEQFGLYYQSLKKHVEKNWLLNQSFEETVKALKRFPDSSFFSNTKDEMIIAYFAEEGEGTLDMADWTKEDGLVAIEYYNGTAGFLTNYTLQFLRAKEEHHYLFPELMKWVELSLLIEKSNQDEFAGKYFYYSTYAKLAKKNQQKELALTYAQKAIAHAKERNFPKEDFAEMIELEKAMATTE